MIIIHVTTYIFVLLLFLLNRLFIVKVWILYYFYMTAKILGSYYGMAQSSLCMWMKDFHWLLIN
jgi:hypothetical protein